MGVRDWLVEKLNPAQSEIVRDQGEDHNTSISEYTVSTSYTNLEVVQRGTNLITDSSSSVKIDVQGKVRKLGKSEVRITKTKLDLLLNFQPNPFQNAEEFFRAIYLDLILEGNAFIYFDKVALYHLPASRVEIEADPKTFVNHYKYGDKKFYPTEMIHIKENSSSSIYRGDSRLISALDSISVLSSMLEFQKNFFKNNAVPGLVLTTENVLSDKLKERFLTRWMRDYNPKRGGKKPMILDGDFKVESLGHTDFRELDFAASVSVHETKILKALGVPPLLLDSGNNANINPNLRLFYITTVIPLVDKICAAFEFYFGYDLKPDKAGVMALRPELKEEEGFYTGLTNAGIITRNEARAALRMPKSTDEIADKLILPANIAGSAVDSNTGGRPAAEDKSEE